MAKAIIPSIVLLFMAVWFFVQLQKCKRNFNEAISLANEAIGEAKKSIKQRDQWESLYHDYKQKLEICQQQRP